MRRALGLILLACVVALLAYGSVWPPHDIHAVDLLDRHAPPSAAHWLGTDHLGRDVFARLARGGWSALLATAIAAAIAFGLGLALGLAAASGGPWLQAACLRLADLTIILPQIVIAVLVVAVAGFSAVSVGIALGIGGVGTYAIMTHALASAVQRERYVLAARAAGADRFRIVRRHVLPAVLPTLATYFAAEAGHAVIHYAALAFLGLGDNSGRPDWGTMLFEYRFYIFDDPRLVLLPGLAIFVFVAAIHAVFEPRAEGASTAWPRLRLGRAPAE